MRTITLVLAFFLAPVAGIITSLALSAPRDAVAAPRYSPYDQFCPELGADKQKVVEFFPIDPSCQVGGLSLYVSTADNQLHFINSRGEDHIVVLERVVHDTETP